MAGVVVFLTWMYAAASWFQCLNIFAHSGSAIKLARALYRSVLPGKPPRFEAKSFIDVSLTVVMWYCGYGIVQTGLLNDLMMPLIGAWLPGQPLNARVLYNCRLVRLLRLKQLYQYLQIW